MFLRNWFNIQAIKLTGSVEVASPSVFGNGSKALKGYNGTVAAGVMNWFGDERITSSTYYSSALLCGLKLAGGWTNASGAEALVNMTVASGIGPLLAVGSGDAEEDFEDYTLTDITDLTHVSYTYGTPYYDEEAECWTGWVARTLTNNTGEEVTVNELGVYLPLYCGNTASKPSMAALVYREVMASSVVMPNGGSFTLGLKFRLPT
jgi:hypothetical protein